ncbi:MULTISPECIES: hypothetical protein [Spirulina sp. CCY15215]|uniref:hypothetical protein n=1 Tax=Spirulina sp. CCY15215 TaxID=2767591 RepID=UPI00194F42BC|nr:hypothetical protein [Spirulina major]
MKRRIALLFFVGLLSACDRQAENNTPGNTANCPDPAASPPTLAKPAERDFPNYFNFQIQNIAANKNIIRFQSLSYDFIFCRGNETWTVTKGTMSPPASSLGAELPYKTVEFQGKTYQYRAVLDPDFTSGQRSQRAVLQLIPPEATEPIVTNLYTLEDIRKANLGNDLAYPDFVSAVPYGDRLLISISAPRGEGFTSIATLAFYNPQNQAIELKQPDKIKGQIIKDIAIAGESDNAKIWLTTQTSGEGNPYIPSMGLVSYDLNSDTITAYHVRNSPLVGAIPTKLWVNGEELWVGTGNGICRTYWQAMEQRDKWNCWRFAVMADLANGGITLYNRLAAQKPALTLEADKVEVLWRSPLAYEENAKERYEIVYKEGFTTAISGGKTAWSEIYGTAQEYFAPLYWPGSEWHWNGQRFQRGFDEVSLNIFGGGPMGIGQKEFNPNNPPDVAAIRGDLDLLELTGARTEVRYYSGWVDEALLSPYVAIVPVQPIINPQPNPLRVGEPN